MALDVINTVDIIEIMENHLERIRPKPEIRDKLDLDYDIDDQSIILVEVRPGWKNPKDLIRSEYAKATFVKSRNYWKVFWKRADLKWHTYQPQATVNRLEDFLNLVEKDEYGCFYG